jgi:hypothetical protein
MWPQRLAPRALPEGRERTPQRAARLPRPPPQQRVHPPPRTGPLISCRVYKLVVNLVRLPHRMYYSGGSTLTSSTGPPSRLGRRGYWQCRPVLPRQAPPPAPQQPLPLQWQQRLALCSPKQQGAGAPSAPKAPLLWGLGYDYPQLAPPRCPNRLRRPAQRGQKAASPAIKGTSSSTHKIET